MLKHRYLYQRALVDEVVLDMVYNAKDKPISERVNFKNLDQHLKAGLIDNGIDLTYHSEWWIRTAERFTAVRITVTRGVRTLIHNRCS